MVGIEDFGLAYARDTKHSGNFTNPDLLCDEVNFFSGESPDERPQPFRPEKSPESKNLEVY